MVRSIGSRLTLVLSAAVFMLVLLAGTAALAQDWPSKPITVVMGFPAGSGVDVVARTLQESMEKTLNARIVTDYRPGAGGNICFRDRCSSAPRRIHLIAGHR